MNEGYENISQYILRAENLLLDEKRCIKIIDFGFGNNFTSDGLLDTFCGYTDSVDIVVSLC